MVCHLESFFVFTAARLVFQKSKADHVSPLLSELHWLPVKFRVVHKLTTFAFRRFDGSLPPHLSSLLNIYQPSRSLRSSDEKLLTVPRVSTKTFCQRSFRYQTPLIWNSLLTYIRFKPRLKYCFLPKNLLLNDLSPSDVPVDLFNCCCLHRGIFLIFNCLSCHVF